MGSTIVQLSGRYADAKPQKNAIMIVMREK